MKTGYPVGEFHFTTYLLQEYHRRTTRKPSTMLGPGDTVVSRTLSCPSESHGQGLQSDKATHHRGRAGEPRELTAEAEARTPPKGAKEGIPGKVDCGLRNEEQWPRKSRRVS